MQISEHGRKVLAGNPKKIENALLEQFPQFVAFQSRTKEKTRSALPASQAPPEPTGTPEELIATASLTLTEALRDSLLARLLESPPTFVK